MGTLRKARLSALLAVVLIAAACSDKKSEDSSPASSPAAASTVTAATAPQTPPAATAEVTTAPDGTALTTTAPAEVITGGTLRVSGESEVANPWTPAAMQCDPYCLERARTFFDQLAVFGSDKQAHPYLAESITPNDDLTQWTVRLRPNISFTDGTPVNADAVIQNLQTTGASLLIAAALTDLAKNPDGSLWIDKVDDLSLTVHTGKGGDRDQPLPWPGFDIAFTTQWGMIASPAWLDAVAAGTADATEPIGSGPFTVESYAPREQLKVKRNPNYWLKDAAGRQLPYLDEIDFRVIEDSETAAQALRAGDIDVFSTSDANVIKDFRDTPAFPMIEQPNFQDTGYLLIDLDKPGPLQDQRVRCALSKAIDRQELIDATAGGIARPANGLFSPGQEGYLDDNGFSTAQDTAGAKALIDAYRAEHPGNIVIHYGTTTAQYLAQVAELLKGYWEAIGVQMDYQQVPQDAFITNALFGAPDFYIYSWRNHAGIYVGQQDFWWNSVNAAPDGQIALNFGRIRDPVVDQNLAIARTNSDPAARRAAGEAINRRMAEQCYQIPISWGLWAIPHSPQVRGVEAAHLPDGATVDTANAFSGLFSMRDVWIDPNG